MLSTFSAVAAGGRALAGVDAAGFELGDVAGGTGSADIAASPTQAGCDWAELFDATPSASEIAAAARACGGVGAVFVNDAFGGAGGDDTVFAKGSSKNDDPLSRWKWMAGAAPAKDDMANFYTFAKLDPNGHLVLYAAVERLAPNGDSHIDFEFNQTGIGLDKAPPCGADLSAGSSDGSPCEFTGGRTPGDLLLVMDFRRGGSLGLVEVRRWDGAAYVLADSLGGEGCDAGRSFCAFNNSRPIDGGPWPNYDAKGAVITTLAANAFTEVGVDVTALFGQSPCFVSVMAKSRSSSSFTSELKDFARADFQVCSFEIDKDGDPSNPNPDLSKIGDDFTFRYTITNTGGATLYLISVIDSFFGDITADALGTEPGAVDAGTGCSALEPGGSCSFTKASAIPDPSDDPFDSSVSASYGDSPSGAVDEAIVTVTDEDTYSLNLFQPSIGLVKTGDAVSAVGDAVDYTITVTNTSSADSPELVNGSITDSLLGDLLDPANPLVVSTTCGTILQTGGSCSIAARRVVQPGDADPLPNTAHARYNPAGGFPNVIEDSDDHVVDLVQPDAALAIGVTPEAAARGEVVSYRYTITNTGNTPLVRISVLDSLLGDVTSSFPELLAPGQTVEVVLTRGVQPGDPDPLLSEARAVYRAEGLDVVIERIAAARVNLIVPCAKSPGFWKGGEGVVKWDDLPSDSIARKAGFETDTVFPWLDSSLTGTSYLGILALSAGGDVTRQLSFKYIAARLNEAAFHLPAETAALLDRCDAYFQLHPVGSDPQGAARDEGQALLDAVNAYFLETGEAGCPPSSEF